MVKGDLNCHKGKKKGGYIEVNEDMVLANKSYAEAILDFVPSSDLAIASTYFWEKKEKGLVTLKSEVTKVN